MQMGFGEANPVLQLECQLLVCHGIPQRMTTDISSPGISLCSFIKHENLSTQPQQHLTVHFMEMESEIKA